MSKFLDGSGLSFLWTKIKNTFYTKTESDNKYAIKTALDNYYDKTTSDNKYALKDSLNNYYQKAETYNQSEIDNLIAGVSGGEIDAYTKTQSDDRYYQKSEVYTKTEADGRYYRPASAISHTEYISTTSKTYTLPAMETNTTAPVTVTASGSPRTNRYLYVNAPSGGSYAVESGSTSKVVSGGSTIVTLTVNENTSVDTSSFRIFRIS